MAGAFSLVPGLRGRCAAALMIAALGPGLAHATAPRPGPPAPPPANAPTVAPQLPRPAVPLEAFFADPEFENPQLSPDGDQLAVIHRVPGSRTHNLKVIDLETLEAQTLTAYDDHDVAWYVWIDERRIAYRAEPHDAGAVSNEWFNVVSFSGGDRHTVRFATPTNPYSAKRRAEQRELWQSLKLLDPRPIGGKHLLVTIRSERLQRTQSAAVAAAHPDVARVNIETGAIRVLAPNPGDVYHWLVDRNGDARIALSLDEELRIQVRHRAPGERDWETLYSFGFGEPGLWPLAFTADSDRVYALSDIDRDTRALHTYDLVGKQLGEVLFAHDKVDVSGLVLSRDGNRAIGARYETDRARIHYFDAFRQAIDTELSDALDEYEVDVQFAEDGQSALVTAHNERNPGRYYHFDADNGRLRELFSERDFLPEQYLSPTHAIDFRASDGERVHGYVTVPRGATGPAPMVVVVHGGPHDVRDRWGFDPEVQFLANRGYAVLQVNFRGSSGYGRRFERLGWGRWGETVQEDIADAVRWTVARGYAEAGRVCIYGWSFGGYSALMNMALNPDLYRCGVSAGGVTDLPRLIAEQSPLEQRRRGFIDLIAGAETDEFALASSSPLHRIDDIAAPVLVAHGLHDEVVPVSHFEKFLAALALYDKPAEGLLLEDQGHGLDGESARYLFYRTLEDFLARHLARGPGPPDPG